MKSYSEVNVFTPEYIEIYRNAVKYVNKIPEELENIRCHELTRAIFKKLDIDSNTVYVVDGKYDLVDHSWIKIDKHILDVYAVGSLPQVQLISTGLAVQYIDYLYRPKGFQRSDIDEEMVIKILESMK